MKAYKWISGWVIIVILMLSFVGLTIYHVDPFFHYHKPYVSDYFYVLNNERSQNDGVIKNFDYDALITGSSMTQNFKTTELDKLFNCNSIKIPFAGGSYKEINDNIEKALVTNHNLKLVVRGLDMNKFNSPPDKMRLDLGEYPLYLYDNNPFNDVEYLLNKDVYFGRVYKMVVNKGGVGITSFDEYSRWQNTHTFGINSVCPDGIIVNKDVKTKQLSAKDKLTIKENIDLNVTNIADKFPNVDFYYFYTPYSMAWWNDQYNSGTIIKQLEIERYVTELIISHNNIHLFSFNNRADIITDLNNYKDTTHYASWISSLILKWMRDGKYQITKKNMDEYFKEEFDFYTSFDYSSLNEQEDYEADYYAAALLNKELTNASPISITEDDNVSITENADGKVMYVKISPDKGHTYLTFRGRKVKEEGILSVKVLDEDGNSIGGIDIKSSDLDYEEHQYVIEIPEMKGQVSIVLFDGYVTEYNHSQDLGYEFSDLCIY